VSAQATYCGCGTELVVERPRTEAVCYLCGVRVFAAPDPSTPRDLELPVVRGNGPVRAVKRARLLVSTDRHDVELMSYGVNRPIAPEGTAACLAGAGGQGHASERHVVPDVACTCGFWAFRPDQARHHQDIDGVLLEVDLGGRVIECERGYRGERQRALAVWLAGRCQHFLCSRQADRWCLAPAELAGPVCSSHLPRSPFVATVAQLTAATGIEFRWGPCSPLDV
jgi:hypothetical protein